MGSPAADHPTRRPLRLGSSKRGWGYPPPFPTPPPLTTPKMVAPPPGSHIGWRQPPCAAPFAAGELGCNFLMFCCCGRFLCPPKYFSVSLLPQLLVCPFCHHENPWWLETSQCSFCPWPLRTPKCSSCLHKNPWRPRTPRCPFGRWLLGTLQCWNLPPFSTESQVRRVFAAASSRRHGPA